MKTAACRWVTPLMCMVLSTGFADTPPKPSGATIHHIIQVGASFLYTQEAKGRLVRAGTFSPRYDAFGHSANGGVIMEVAEGPRTETPHGYIHQVAYGLAPGGCVVDVISGITLLSGAQCNQPLPVGVEWTIRTRDNVANTCKVTGLGIQQVAVPAGTFGVTEIHCSSAPDLTGAQTASTYWYSADIGAMAKAVHRKVDSDGHEIFSISEELRIYEAAPIKTVGRDAPSSSTDVDNAVAATLAAGDACVRSLPTEHLRALEKTHFKQRLLQLSDLGPEQQIAWKKAYGNACPGVVHGTFTEPDQHVVLLVPRKPDPADMFIEAHLLAPDKTDRVVLGQYQLKEFPALRRAPPGLYEDLATHGPINISNEVIVVDHLNGKVTKIAFANGDWHRLGPAE